MDIRLPLPAALRQRVREDESLWAHVTSLLISPPVVWSLWAYAVTLSRVADPGSAAAQATLFAMLVCFGPMFFIAYMVRIGRIGDLHMRLSRERYLPYTVAISGSVVCGLVYLRLEAAPILQLLTLVSIVQLTIMLLGTFFLHLSLHAMAMASIVSATYLVYGMGQALLLLPLLLLVVAARLVLRRHTPAQVISGALIGLLTPLVVVVVVGAFV